jgi:hypothetical protein
MPIQAIDPELAGSLSLTAGLGLLMLWLARGNDLVHERNRRRCPSCGRLTRPRESCRCSSPG